MSAMPYGIAAAAHKEMSVPQFANLHPTEAVLQEYYELANRQLGLGEAGPVPSLSACGAARAAGVATIRPARRRRALRAPR
ncbi:MAG: hypothetical protein P4L83_16090 [Nevskia sp.]|nr:hypothetical protein [Nevskia sp.]